MYTTRSYPELRTEETGSPYGLNKADPPSSATGHLESRLDLNKYIAGKPASTYFTTAEGDASGHLGIRAGDLLVIDRSLAPRHDSLVLTLLEGEVCVCRLVNKVMDWYLVRGDGRRQKMDFEDAEMIIWGRITHIIHPV